VLEKKKGEEVNPVLSGYFWKIVITLLAYKPKEIMSYIYSKQTVLEKMLEHVYDKSICDIIIKVLNISNNATSAQNNSVNNDSGDIFGSPGKHAHSREEIGNSFIDYESNRNQIVHKLIDKLIRAKTHEEYWNSSTILWEMAKFSHMFEFLSCSEIMEKISIGLENEDEEGIKWTLKLFNTIIKEYSKDGTNKRVNISALQEDGESEKEADIPTVRVENVDDLVKDKIANTDKSGDQSGSNLSKSANVKENIKEVQFINTLSNIIPLVVQLIKDEQNQKYIDTTYQSQVKVFGGMRLEAVEFIRLITSKFWNTYQYLFTLFERYPNNWMLHSKIEEIVSFSLKHGGIDIIEEIIYKAQLIKYILELSTTEKQSMTYKNTQNKCSFGFVPYIINIANELVKQAKSESEISNTLESIPEWGKFQEGILKSKNDVLVAPLGGRDPRAKIDSLFDDNDFLGRFKGFKPVPFESIKNRRKNMHKKNEIEMEQETEEEEEDDEDKLEMEDIDQYYEDNDEVIELNLKDTPDYVFSKSSKVCNRLLPFTKMSNIDWRQL
jgi:SIT4 phosphatase-associated protein